MTKTVYRSALALILVAILAGCSGKAAFEPAQHCGLALVEVGWVLQQAPAGALELLRGLRRERTAYT